MVGRIGPISPDAKLTPQVAGIIAFAEKSGAPDPRMAKVMVRSEVGIAVLEAWHTALYKGLIPHRLKEIVRIYISVGEGCAYCSSIRSTQGRAEGVTDDLLRDLVDIDNNKHLSEKEKAGLRYARAFKNGDADDDKVWADLQKHFSDEEIVELGYTCGMIYGGAAFARQLHIVDWDVCTVKPADLRATAKAS